MLYQSYFRGAVQVEESGIEGQVYEIEAQLLVRFFPIMVGHCLKIAGAAATTENLEHWRQQQEPLRIIQPEVIAVIWNGLEKLDHFSRSA